MKTSKRRDTQMDNGQTVHKNRTLTHELKQPVQTANPLPAATGLGSQTAVPVAISPTQPELHY